MREGYFSVHIVVLQNAHYHYVYKTVLRLNDRVEWCQLFVRSSFMTDCIKSLCHKLYRYTRTLCNSKHRLAYHNNCTNYEWMNNRPTYRDQTWNSEYYFGILFKTKTKITKLNALIGFIGRRKNTLGRDLSVSSAGIYKRLCGFISVWFRNRVRRGSFTPVYT